MSTYDISNYQPGYGGVIDSTGEVKNIADIISEEGRVKIEAELTVADIQIGAVEIKNGQATSPANEYRMTVNSDGSLNMRIIGSIDGGTF